MLRNKTFPLLMIAVAVMVALLLLPVLMRSGAPGAICGFGAAAQGDCSAQETRIAEQELTLAFYGVLAAQATVDVANYRSTIAALEVQNPAEPTPVEGLPFYEDFADNSTGWALSNSQNTAVNVADGQLFIGAAEVWSTPALVPDLRIENFHAEVLMNSPFAESIFVGFLVGSTDFDPPRYHLIVTGSDWDAEANQMAWYVRLYNWDGAALTMVASEEYSPFWQPGDNVQLALDAQSGSYVLSINGYQTQQFTFTPYGDRVGLVVHSPDNALNQVRYAFFDDLRIEAR